MNWLAGKNQCYNLWGDAGTKYTPDIQSIALKAPAEQLSDAHHCRVFYGIMADIEISLMGQCSVWEPTIIVYDKTAIL